MRSFNKLPVKPALAALLLPLLMGFSSGCKTKYVAHKMMPMPNLYKHTDAVLFKPDLHPRLKTTHADVIYATDRNSIGKAKTEYGANRSTSLAFGRVRITAKIKNKEADWDTLTSVSASPRDRRAIILDPSDVTELGRYPKDPYPLVSPPGAKIRIDPSVAAADRKTTAALQSLVRERLALTPKKEILIFVHGVNTSFEDAAIVMGEFWHFMGREGVPVIYSWPAGGRGGGAIQKYNYDRESSEFTVHHFKKFVRALSGTPGLERIHFIAHSRGTDVTASMLKELIIEARAAGSNAENRFKIGKLIVAAPDIDLEVTTQKFSSEHIGRDLEKLVLYSSGKDRAIGLSEWLFRSIARLGQLQSDELSEEDLETFERVPNAEFIENKLKTDWLGHGYFHNHPATSSDLILLLRDNRPAGAEHGRPLKPIGKNFWQLNEGYPARQ